MRIGISENLVHYSNPRTLIIFVRQFVKFRINPKFYQSKMQFILKFQILIYFHVMLMDISIIKNSH